MHDGSCELLVRQYRRLHVVDSMNDRRGRGIGESEDDNYYYSAAPGCSAPKPKSRIDPASMGASSIG